MDFRMLSRRAAAALGLVLATTLVLAAAPSYELHVDGLSCPFCAYGMEKKLGALPGVQRLETRIKDGTVVVTMKDGMTLDEVSAKRAVKEAGFSLRKLEQVQSPMPDKPAEKAK